MSDLNERVARALESPVASPPELDAIERRARRHRHRRRTGRIASGVALTTAALLGAFALTRGDDGPPRVSVGPTVTNGRTTPATTDDARYGAANLVHDLADAGMKVSTTGTASGNPLSTDAQLLCVNGTEVRVYEYSNRASRLAVSKTISPDGSRVGNGHGSFTIAEWIGPPHFYARGRIIVLVLQNDPPLLDALTRILGPTVSPDAGNGITSFKTHCSN